MKNVLPFLVAASFIIAIGSPLHAQWIQTNGPCTGRVTHLAISGANLFAASASLPNEGVYRSTDNGRSWREVLGAAEVTSFALSGTYLIAASSIPGSLYRSSDNGTSWTSIGLANTEFFALGALGSTLFAGTSGGLILTTDAGVSWAATGLTVSDVNCFGFSDTNIFAGTAGGAVYRSTDDGSSWTAVNSVLGWGPVESFAALDTNLFAATRQALYLSTDDGSSWSAVSGGLPDGDFWTVLVSDTVVYAGADGKGVFRSTDHGLSWGTIDSGMTNANIFSLASSGMNIVAGTGIGVFLSTDGGAQWSAIGLPVNGVSAVAASPAYLFAGGFDIPDNPAGVYRSTDNGSSWTPAGLGQKGVYTLLVSGTDLFAATDYGVYRSSNGGFTWTAANSGLPYYGVYSLVRSGTNLLAGTGGGGVFLSTDNGSSWTRVDSQLTYYSIRSLAISPSGMRLLAATNLGIFLSSNNGANWTVALPNIYGSCLAALGTTLFAGTEKGVFRSSDDGATWIVVGFKDTSVSPVAVSGTSVFACTYGGLFISTDNGVRWKHIDSGMTNVSVGTLTVSGTDLIAGTARGVWRRPLAEIIPNALPQSVQAGWNLLSLPNKPYSHTVEENYPGVISRAFEYSGGYKECDTLHVGKGYWLNLGADTEYQVWGEPAHQETVLVSSGWNIIGSLSSAFLASSITSEPPGMVTSSFEEYDGVRYVGRDTIEPGKGYWVRVNQAGKLMLSSDGGGSAFNRIRVVPTNEQPPPPPGSDNAMKKQLPLEYALHQNYPNPFNPSTDIRFSIPTETHVTLKVCDILGRVVTILVNEQKSPGEYTVRWNAQGMPSGVYFYRIQAGGFTATKKLLIIR